ncbi:superoxide dismutase [Ni] [Rhodopirellula sallentina]|uniref:Superoxide dismutase Ni-type n=1 Tax=Rhodopirellula sallentina SM41 TaxID=1263870 RepID=M5TZI6_9BACT|nr:superoxide dismutase [Ni] [Rhodopirellula sallentina]EMI54444.1 Superoxide dismutase Ni-type [Rhodopirellula sallentina SM41]
MLRCFTLVALLFGSLALASTAHAHCQVPCGIYGDQLRFEMMLEDEHTISKAQTELNTLKPTDAQSINQLTRWVTTKEDHASRIQETIASYFMAQRIKTSDPAYVKKLAAAHAVMVNAMKAKQSADPATAKALEKSIFDFYRAYEGKEPTFEHSH